MVVVVAAYMPPTLPREARAWRSSSLILVLNPLFRVVSALEVEISPLAPKNQLGRGQGVTVSLCNLYSLRHFDSRTWCSGGILSLALSLVHLPLLDCNPIEKNSELKLGCKRKDAKIKIRDHC